MRDHPIGVLVVQRGWIGIIGGCAALGLLLGFGTGLLVAGGAPGPPTDDELQLVAEADVLTNERELDEASLDDLVADAQRMLSMRGYQPGPVDGQLGLRTQAAIRGYQDTARTSGLLKALKGQPAPGPIDDARYDIGARPTPGTLRGE